MDQELVNYIIRYYRNLMTEDERLAFSYQVYTLQAGGDPDRIRRFKALGWLRETEGSLELLQKGQEAFERDIAVRILQETPEQVFLNNCPQCRKLARTPMAKQCWHCGYSTTTV